MRRAESGWVVIVLYAPCATRRVSGCRSLSPALPDACAGPTRGWPGFGSRAGYVMSSPVSAVWAWRVVAGRADSEDAGHGEPEDGAGRVVAASPRACDLAAPGAHCRIGAAGRLGQTTPVQHAARLRRSGRRR